MSEKYYITTPIYYVNAAPHIGHAYTTIAADVLARDARLRGCEVRFLVGTDENSQKNVEAAKRAEKPVREYVDEMAATWRRTWEELGITFDDFIRTTEERHVKGVEKFYNAVKASGDIYKGTYEGYYCVGCEAYLTERDLVNGQCSLHKTSPQVIKEENYFFKLSRFRGPLLTHIKEHPEFIQPEKRRNEIVRYIQDHLEDISISRATQEWGIPVPGDSTQTLYVWFDALLNYITAVGYGADEEQFQSLWPADLHLVGKDIIKFHCALWPAMLMSVGFPLPQRVFAHGFFTMGGEKISKSLGNVIDPLELSREWGRDVVRYFLFREIAFGEDGNFSLERLAERYEGELSNGLGNLVARVTKLAEAGLPSCEGGDLMGDDVKAAEEAYAKALDAIEPHTALEQVWSLIALGDALFQEQQPWTKDPKDPGRSNIVAQACELLWHIGWLLKPFMPETSAKIFDQLGGEEGSFPDLAWDVGRFSGRTVKKGESLFPRKVV